MAAVNCLVTNILQNILFCVQQKKETNTGLKQPEGEWMTILIFVLLITTTILYK